MHNLIQHNDEPAKRMGLKKTPLSKQQFYWRIRA